MTTTAHPIEADLWLGFGSFLYGFQTDLEDVSLDTITLIILSPALHNDVRPSRTGRTAANTQELFCALHRRSRSLVRSEIRLYFDERLCARHALPDRTIRMTSPLGPELLPIPDGSGMTRIRLRALDAIRPVDALLWREFVSKIWRTTRE